MRFPVMRELCGKYKTARAQFVCAGFLQNKYALCGDCAKPTPATNSRSGQYYGCIPPALLFVLGWSLVTCIVSEQVATCCQSLSMLVGIRFCLVLGCRWIGFGQYFFHSFEWRALNKRIKPL